MGDGGFWHNGLVSSVGNAVFNKADNVIIVVDNGYSAATGGQDILSSHHPSLMRNTQNAIEKAVRGIGVTWARTIERTYDLKAMVSTLREALTTPEKGAEGHRRSVGVHAEQAAPRAAADEPGDQGRQAGGARALRRRPRHLHRRPLLHPAVRLPVADHRARTRTRCARTRSRR